MRPGLFMLALCLHAGAAPAAGCVPPRFDDTVTVARIIDGDTVVAADGTHVRLIGLDAPELGRDGRPDEAGARAAQTALASVLGGAGPRPVAWDAERLDRHGRTLAHLFAVDGANVQERMLADGHAAPFPFPPNLRYVDCYAAAADAAIGARRGIWALPAYAPRRISEQDGVDPGYRIVSGRVVGISRRGDEVRIGLGVGFAVRITRDDLRYFDSIDLYGLAGRNVSVRGLVYGRNPRSLMRIRHPSDLAVATGGTQAGPVPSN